MLLHRDIVTPDFLVHVQTVGAWRYHHLALAMTHSQSSGTPRLLLMTLVMLADGDGVVRKVSIRHLCELSTLTRSTVHSGLRTLIVIGEIEVVAKGSGRGSVNQYRVMLEKFPKISTHPELEIPARWPLKESEDPPV